MVVYSHDDFLMCCVFPSSLKGVALDLFHSLPPQSLWSFEEVSNAFFNQYASRQELKKNSNHLLTARMQQRETLKRYISHFQSQMAPVYNCNEDVTVTASVNGLEINYSLYKHLMKYDVTNMKDILFRA